MRSLCACSLSTWRPYGLQASDPALNRAGGASGMADVLFLAIGGGAFVAFAALAVFLKRV
jgi:hypothetical protein